jgi:ABC-2 type transport system ATP-binding protein
MYAVETDQLAKSFDGLTVLQGLDMHVPEGAVYGLVGPSNAGKTTLLHLILGFLHKDAGMLRVLGTSDIEPLRGQIGYVPQGIPLPAGFSVREYLRFLGRCGGLAGRQLEARIQEELDAVRLASEAERMIERLARPMLQRLAVAQALLGRPALLLLDEPTSGAELSSQHDLLDLIAEIRSRGQTIILATQFLEEAEYLCDHVGILFGGKIAAEAPMHTLRGPGRNALITLAEMPEPLAEKLRKLSPAVQAERQEIALQPNTPELQTQVLRLLLDEGATIIGLEPFGRPLEDLYRRVVRGEAQPGRLAQPVVGEPPDSQPRITVPLAAEIGRGDTANGAPVLPGRSSGGDTLLRELLQREEHHDQ